MITNKARETNRWLAEGWATKCGGVDARLLKRCSREQGKEESDLSGQNQNNCCAQASSGAVILREVL